MDHFGAKPVLSFLECYKKKRNTFEAWTSRNRERQLFFPTLTALLLSELSSSVCRPVELGGLPREFWRRRVGGVPRRSQSCLASVLQGTWEGAWVSGTASKILEYTFVQHLQKPTQHILSNVPLRLRNLSSKQSFIEATVSGTTVGSFSASLFWTPPLTWQCQSVFSSLQQGVGEPCACRWGSLVPLPWRQC